MFTIDIDKLDLAQNDLVLDIGSGSGRHTKYLYSKGYKNTIAIDLFAKNVLDLKASMQDTEQIKGFCIAANEELPFASNSIDAVISSEVMEHVPDWQSAIGEISRVLKKNGKLAISVPSYLPEQLCWWLSPYYHKVRGGHIRIFRKSKLIDGVSKFNLSLYHVGKAHGLHSFYWWLQCLLWKKKDTSKAVQGYRKFLESQLLEPSRFWFNLERYALNPLLGKSLVLYFRKV